MNKPLQQTWDLESIFSGGSHSPEFAAFLSSLEKEMKELRTVVVGAKVPADLKGAESLEHILTKLESSAAKLSEAGSFVGCLAAQDQNDKKAIQLSGRVTTMYADLQSISTTFDNLLRGIDDTVWEAWTSTSKVKPYQFILNESRDLAREKMNPEMESLALELAIDGYHGWGEFYDTIVSKIQIPFEEDGKTKMLSAGQAHNQLHNPNREIRQDMFEKWEKAWTEAGDYCADTLNHLAGFRLKLYANRGWDDVLKEPLAINRMSRETLDTMWAVIQDAKPMVVQYLNRKAKLLGLDGLSWTDVEAPIRTSVSKVTYDEAAETIVEQFGKFSSRLAEFSQMAFDKSWIEAEDRPGKRPGGFCTSFQESNQTRIFMTFGGTASNVSTLAHELGHAYHQFLMKGLPVLNQNYAMNVAETASTFAEMIVADALVKSAKNEEEKLALLEEKIQNSVAFFMNIHARFLFETRFYDKRKEGLLNQEEISDLMEEAQKEAYCGALTTYHPHFWASKLHFYSTGVPFYNFPYTFGYLFSTGLYVRALEEGSPFADKYDALLRDTGIMTVEELAKKHLDVDLTQRDFWQSAVDMCLADIGEFLQMTEHLALI
ncbi:M3 family oligoendopeptidase [Paenibacillus dakarensis]|uniref:M3 family oligoendopeptidase n=1 Tax=Paenibacillus dakarensis TaxID=1527293 RepID=UPI0006D59F93|nr:M3 family oligoendopeptidase [Paenibacillus dakarensis]